MPKCSPVWHSAICFSCLEQLLSKQGSSLRSTRRSMLRITKVLFCIAALLALWVAGLGAELPASTHQTIFWVSRNILTLEHSCGFEDS